MGMTMTQKILAAHCGMDEVKAGQFIDCPLDLVMGNDITAPVAIKEFVRIGKGSVFDPEKIALIPDHFIPNKDIKAAQQCKVMREFAAEHGIKHYYEVGRGGIEHALIPEQGLVSPGDVIIGADSHTCTYGALGAFSTGVGSTDMAAGMATGKAWFRVPSALRINLTGEFMPHVSGKDLILWIIGLIGTDGAGYMSIEIGGPGMASLSMDDRFTVANMGVEAGAKNCIFEVDNKTIEYVRVHSEREPVVYMPDDDAEYERIIDIDLAEVPLIVAEPHSPQNIKPVFVLEKIKIDQAVIGSCTNGRISDLRAAAAVLSGRKVHPGVRLIIVPATQEIYKQALREGLLDIFIEAGAAVSTPTCGCCLGGHMGVLAENEVCVSTTNRNFAGRMGHISSKVYLAGPAVAAASAVAGYITTPELI